MSQWVLTRCLWTAYCILTVLMCIDGNVISEDFYRCNHDTFWTFSSLQSHSGTSYMSCALLCGTTNACIGFNACTMSDGPTIDCMLISENVTAELRCDSPLMSHVTNCTVTKKGHEDQKSVNDIEVPQSTCSSRNEKVFETTHDGTILFGNKSELIQRVRQGDEVRILLWEFNAKHQLFSTNQITVNDQDVCAQTVFSRDMSFYFTRQILMVCSSGYIQEQQWIIGMDMKERDITAWVKSTWFADGNCRTPTTLLTELRSDIANGYDIMVLAENNRFPLHSLEDFVTQLSAHFAWGVPRIDSMANQYTSNVDGNCVWQSRTLGYSGHVINVKWQSGNGSHVALVNDTNVQMTWLADTRWKLGYENSDSGETMYGLLSDLHDYVNAGGHRVRVVFGNYAAEADSLFLQGDNISAVFVKGINCVASENGPRGVTTIVTTTGRHQRYEYGIANSQIIQADTTMIGAKWYIDAMNWTEVLRVQNGIVDNSFPDIFEGAIKSGMAFRAVYITSFGNISFSGESVRLSLLNTRQSVIVNHITDLTTESGKLVLCEPIGNLFYKFNSDGTMNVKAFDNGSPTVRFVKNREPASFSWFVRD